MTERGTKEQEFRATLPAPLSLDLPVGSSRWTMLRAGSLVLAFLFAYFPVLRDLCLDWYNYPWNSHGFLIPVLSGYLVWHRRHAIRAKLGDPSLAGFGVFAFGLILLFIGLKGEEELVTRVSLPLTLLGLTYFLWGRAVTMAVLLPVACLLLMIPIPYTLNKGIALPLQLLDAKLAAAFLSLLGIPIFQQGVLLHLPSITLEVADLCSGLQSMVALTPLAIAYIYHLDTRFKPFLYLSILPVAILANVIRIIVTAILTHYSGVWVLNTTVHTLSGIFNFLLGFATLVLIAKLLEKKTPKEWSDLRDTA